MKLKVSSLFTSLFLTIILLIILEIISTSLLPSLGLKSFHLPINVLIILFLGFKLQTPYLPLLIISVQLFHGAFTIEGWALGTFVGIILSIVIAYFSELIHLSSRLATMVVTFIFSLLWTLTELFILSLKSYSGTQLWERFLDSLPESIVVALIAPVFFSLLDKVWKVRDSSSLSYGG